MIKIHPYKTGTVFLRNFDEGIMTTMGAIKDPPNKCYRLSVDFGNGTPIEVPVYFAQPEAVFKRKVFPFITVNRDDIAIALQRWMGVGQLEYRAGVSGTYVSGYDKYRQYETKPQAFPHDITYTISVWDRYEKLVQPTLLKVLKAFNPMGKLIVYDSLNLERSYEYYIEGSVANLQEVIDPATRARGYALTVRVEGEIDLLSTDTRDTVSGFDLSIYSFDE